MDKIKCNICKKEKNKTDFYTRKDRPKGIQSMCKICKKEKYGNYRDSGKAYYFHQVEKDPLFNRKKLLKKYNLTIKCFEYIKKGQDYKCAICKTPNPGGRSNDFHIDHCHKTGKIRGLLCQNCNQALGKFKDNILFLEKAIKYLKNG